MMLCSQCRHVNKPQARFCAKCGFPLHVHQQQHTTSGRLEEYALLQGRYQIIEEIGRGGMGAVYIALDHRFAKRICVVKEMLDYYQSSADATDALQRFNREADTLATLNHPGIPYVFDRFTEGNRHYLVMEYVSGLDLNKTLKAYMQESGEPIPEEDVADYLYHLTIILDYLHEKRPPIYHRDIKPHNIIINMEGRLKLVDFGIAKVFQNAQRGTGIGTQGYAAPEQYKGLVDHRTDLYALGATMHHLLTGRDPQYETPFDYPEVQSFVPQLSDGMNQLITWMLQPNPDHRPQGAIAVREALLHMSDTLEHSILQNKGTERPVGQLIMRYASQARITKNGQKLCPKCLSLNRGAGRFCKECGHALESFGLTGSTSL